MPKSYSEQEKAYIIKRLKEEAAYCLGQYGIKRTTVDELVKRVNIPKGTFYLFYESKELLLFEVIIEMHEGMEKCLVQKLASCGSGITADQLSSIIFELYKAADQSPVVKLLTTGEIEILIRKLPEKLVQEHFIQDNTMIEKILTLLPHAKTEDTETLSAAFRAIFMAILHKREIGEDHFDEAMRLLMKGTIMQFM